VLVHEMLGHGTEHLVGWTVDVIARRDLASEAETVRATEIVA